MSSDTATGHPKYRADIDGLRAVAVVAVVLFHAYPTAWQGGFTGVDVFFVISGFLISTIIMGQLGRGKFSFADFYSRRVRRIFPALSLVLVACFVAGWIILLPIEFEQLGKHIAGGCGFVSNLVLWKESGYFDTNAETKVLLHLWSLGIEEQFYLFWPLLLSFVGVPRIRLVLGGVIVASFAYCMFLVPRDSVAGFYNPASRFWELLVGGALAWLELHAAPSMNALRARASVRHAMSIAGAVLVGCGIGLLDKTQPFPGWRALLPSIGAFLLIAAGPNAVVNRFVLGNRVAVAIGLISYPLYLWHWPALAFVRIVVGLPPKILVRTLAVLGSVLAAYLTYRFVEKPVRHGRTATALVVINGVLLLGGLGTAAAGGFAGVRGPWNVANVEQKLTPEDFSTPACRRTFVDVFQPTFDFGRDDCHSTRPPEGPIDVVVVGDSHAGRIYTGLRDASPTSSLLIFGRGSCMPYLGYDAISQGPGGTKLLCQPTMDRMIEVTLAKAPPVVVVSAFFSRPLDQSMLSIAKEPLPALIAKTIERLSAGIRHVVIVLDVPLLPFEPSECVDRPFSRSARGATNGRCAFPRTAVAADRAIYEGDLRRGAENHPNVIFFDPVDAFCDAETCFAVREKNLLYDDRHHLSRYGAKLVGEALRARLDELLSK